MHSRNRIHVKCSSSVADPEFYSGADGIWLTDPAVMASGISVGFRKLTRVGFGGLSIWLAVKYVRDGRVGRDNGLSVKMLFSSTHK